MTISQSTINQFQMSRKGAGESVVLEGLHAFKHAHRFGAQIIDLYTCDKVFALDFLDKFASHKERTFFDENVYCISEIDFLKLTTGTIRTKVIALAIKGAHQLNDIDSTSQSPIVILEDSRDLANVGAVARVCAARGASALITIGETSPWNVRAIRGGAGLQWAMPTIATNLSELKTYLSNHVFVICSDEGEDMYETKLSGKIVYIFGTERSGISAEMRLLANKVISIPMQRGVSSMNLATSVSAILFASK